VAAFLLVTMGGIVCATGAARGCPDWPGCYGRVLPPARVDAIIEFLHRFVALLAGPLIVASAIAGWRAYRSRPWLVWPPVAAVVLTAAVVVFGAFAVLTGLPPVVAAIDFGCALTVLALLVTTAVAAFHGGRVELSSSLSRLSLAAVVAVFVTFVSGIFAAGSAPLARCLGWPVYGATGEPGPAAWLVVARQFMAAAASLLILAAIIQAWRAEHRPSMLRPAAAALGILLLAATLAGLFLPGSSSLWLLAVYVALAAGVWAVLIAVTILGGVRAAAPAGEPVRQPRPAGSAAQS
jgi:heme A synthase